MAALTEALGRMRDNGVSLWSEEGQLRYRAPKGALTNEDLVLLREFRGHIIGLLESDIGHEQLAIAPARVPLTFSQLARWTLLDLGRSPSVRQVACAARLVGRLHTRTLRDAIRAVIRRHAALRTRIVRVDDAPMQEVADSVPYELELRDLRSMADEVCEHEAKRLIEQHLLEPFDLAAGPLFDFGLLRLRDDEHVLLVALDHMISDAWSLNILLRDLFALYSRAIAGREPDLPPVRVSFPQYAVWQHRTRDAWVSLHGEYWRARLAGCERVRFPARVTDASSSSRGWSSISMRIDSQLKNALSEWSRVRGTTLAMSVFTAYVALLLRWCRARDIVIQYQTTGRAGADVENTIGYFASILYLRIAVGERENFLDILDRATQEYCSAFEHADYSQLAAQVPSPPFARNSMFNWVPETPRMDVLTVAGPDPLECSVLPTERRTLKDLDWDNEPSVIFFESDIDVVGTLCFPAQRFALETIQCFSRNFLMFIEKLMCQPELPVDDIALLE